MENSKMKTKDYIYAGAFSAIYLVVAMLTSMILWFVPVLAIYGMPLIVGMVCSPIYLMYVMKIKKFGAILILSALIGIAIGGGGHIYTLYFALPIGLLAELVCKQGKYESKLMFNLSYIVFNLIAATPSINFITAKEETIAMCVEYYGQDYGDALNLLITDYMLFILVVLSLVGAYLGILITSKLFKKHFDKAGVM